MADKIFVDMKTVEHFKSLNPKIPNDKPVIGFCPDWRKLKDEDGNYNYYYMEVLLNMYKNSIENSGGVLYYLSFQDKAKDVENIIDGYLIPGGRDIDPKNYNGERVSNIHEEAEERYEHLKDMVLNLPKKIPILGICLGFEFINVLFGGSLENDIKGMKQHYKKRKFNITKGTILNELIGDIAIGNCYHHQGIKTLGKDLIVNSLDEYHQTVHGLEYIKDGKWILTVLWHPESSFECEKGGETLIMNRKIYQGFVNEVIKRKKNQ